MIHAGSSLKRGPGVAELGTPLAQAVEHQRLPGQRTGKDTDPQDTRQRQPVAGFVVSDRAPPTTCFSSAGKRRGSHSASEDSPENENVKAGGVGALPGPGSVHQHYQHGLLSVKKLPRPLRRRRSTLGCCQVAACPPRPRPRGGCEVRPLPTSILHGGEETAHPLVNLLADRCLAQGFSLDKWMRLFSFFALLK